jgi:hypothetical protein
LLAALSLAAAVAARAAAGADRTPVLAQYLPAGVAYAPEVPVPSSVLGFEVGVRPVTPAELESYMRRLAASSDRVLLEEQGRTHEGRPQLLLTLSTPANLARLESWRQAHLALTDPARPAPTAAELAAAPLVIWLAYSIHGDEASGSNASMVVAYHLAAARDAAVEELLSRAVVLIDPSQNPDGMARFASWVASHGSAEPVADPAHREKHEPWPTGRGNHYWLDLNRDWMATEQPESRARVATFQRWRPHVVADLHEMGSGATYFFQPGVPERTHPLTPARNQELTAALARFHAADLDRAGRPYFTRERYDDFYYGKGSTYPDIQGAVGVLFEQSTTAGLVMETAERGVTLDFATAVHDHVLGSLSTLRGSLALRDDLVRHQLGFYREPAAEARGGWVCGDAEPSRVRGLARVLRRHGIELAGLGRDLEAGGVRFPAASSFLVPRAQRQHRLVTAMLEERREFPATAFYDISTWTFSHAWNVPCRVLGERAWPTSAPATELGAAPATAVGSLPTSPSTVAWAFEWGAHGAARAVQRLLAGGVRVRVALRPFVGSTMAGERAFAAGAIVVPAAGQRLPADQVVQRIAEAASAAELEVAALTSGLVASGVDLGSDEVQALAAPRVALVVGEGIDPAGAGALWHALDQRFGVPVTLLDRHRLADIDFDRYTHLLLPDGEWGDLPPALSATLGGWLERGGVLVAFQEAASWAGVQLLPAKEGAATAPAAPPATDAGAAARAEQRAAPLLGRYAAHSDHRARDLVAGAIVEVELDPSHPLALGYSRPTLPVFRSGTALLAAPVNPYELVARYRAMPVLAGYMSGSRESALAGTPALLATRRGEGLLVRFADDPVFRTAWHGGETLLANALFFGPLVGRRPFSSED